MGSTGQSLILRRESLNGDSPLRISLRSISLSEKDEGERCEGRTERGKLMIVMEMVYKLLPKRAFPDYTTLRTKLWETLPA